jgi:tetratricopeptide (TPR) repeat protein
MVFNTPRRTQRLLEAARGYLLLHMPDQALAELADVDDPGGQEFEWHLLRGEALRERKDYRSAIAAFERAQAVEPEDLDVLMGLAWCYKRTSQLPKSIAAMHRAYQGHPDVPIVLYNLSCYYSLAGEKEQALSWLGRALRMQSDLKDLIADETDFDPLRNDADFRQLLELAAK